MYGMNLSNKTTASVELPDLSYNSVFAYSLEPVDGNLQSTVVALNDVPLYLTANHQLPPLNANRHTTRYMSIKPLTFAFFVVEAGLDVCM